MVFKICFASITINKTFRQKNKNLTILRTNFIFGTRSYLVRYLTQNFLENIDPINISAYKKFNFNPL